MSLPDVELVTVTYLRTVTAVTTLCGSRIYTVVPNDPTFPLLRVVRIGGGPATSKPLHMDVALLQVDAFGGSKHQARALADAAMDAFTGMEAVTHSGAVVTGVRFGTLAYAPDSSYEPAKPRYRFDVSLYLH